MGKKSTVTIIIILVALSLIVIAIRVFDKRMEIIEKKMNSSTNFFDPKNFDSHLKKTCLFIFKTINLSL